MKSLVTLVTFFSIWIVCTTTGYSQKYPDFTKAEVEKLTSLKEQIVNEEKAALKTDVENINVRLQSEAITATEAENLKQIAAEKHALNIENRIAIVDNQLSLIARNGIDSTKIRGTSINLGLGTNDSDNNRVFGLQIQGGSAKKIKEYDRRTTTGLFIASGFLDAVGENESYGNTQIAVGRSSSFELGLNWKTRVFNNSNFLRLKYGLAFQWNKFVPRGNNYFVDTDGLTVLEEFPLDLKDKELRLTNLVVPIFFEFGPSKKIEKEDYFRYSTIDQFKIGVGGYAGFNIGASQKLKYREDGERVKQKIKKDYNTTDFVYGVGAYVGVGSFALYAKYDISPIFKNQPLDQNALSLGFRLDLD